MLQATQSDRPTLSEPDRLNLAPLSVGQLIALHAAYRAASDAYLGIWNQPRGEDVDILEDERERCYVAMNIIIAEIKRRPVDPSYGFWALQILVEQAESADEMLRIIVDEIGRAPGKVS